MNLKITKYGFLWPVCLVIFIWLMPIRALAQCPQPTDFTVASLTQTTASFMWGLSTTDETPASYQLKVSSTPLSSMGTTAGIFDGIVSSTYHYLENLTEATTYYVYIRSDCSGNFNGYSAWTSATFTTLCEPVSLPLSEGLSTSAIPTNWNISGSVSTNATVRRGGVGYSIMLSNTASLGAYFITPPLNSSADGMELSFFAYGSLGTPINVGILLDVADVSTLIPLYEGAITSAGTWQEFVIPTANLGMSDNGLSLVIYLEGSDRISTLYIDDIEIRATNCQMPTNLSTNSLTSTSINLQWTDNSLATAWELSLITDIDTTLIAANSNPYTLNALTPNTNYSVGVKSKCSATELSRLSAIVSFTTPCEAISTPFSIDFETLSAGVPDCWNNLKGSTINPPYRWNYYTESNGNKCLRFNSYANSIGLTNTLEMLPLTLGSNDMLTFMYKNPTGGSMNVGISTDGGVTVTPLATLNNQATWKEYIYILTEYANQTVTIVFTGTSNAGSGDAYLYLDNISVAPIPNCFKPTEFSFTDILSNSVVANITDTRASAWEIVVGAEGFLPDASPIMSYNTSTALITGLSSETTYEAYVRAVCSTTEKSDWYGPINFTTACGAFTITDQTPFFEGFETRHPSGAAIAGCWEQESITGEGPWIANSINTTYNRTPRTGSFNATLYYSNTDWLFYRVNLQAGVNYQFRAYARQDGAVAANASLTLAYGIEATAENMTNIVVNSSLTNGNYQIIVGSFDVPTNGIYVVGIKGTINNSPYYISLDDISISVENCPAPSNLAASEITATTATLSWTEAADNYNLKVFSTLITDVETATGDVYEGLVSAASYSLAELDPQTTYYYAIQNVCGEHVSEWSELQSFTTPCKSFVVTEQTPLHEGFENGFTNAEIIAGCWSQEDVSGGNVWQANTSETSYNRTPRTGNFNATLKYNNTDWLFYHVTLEADQNYLLRVYARQDGSIAANASLTLAYGQEATAEGMTTELITQPLINGDYQMVAQSFAIGASGDYVVGIKGTINNSPWYISLDDVSLRLENCPMPSNLMVTDLSDNTATITWQQNADSYKLKVFSSAIDYNSIDTANALLSIDDISGGSYQLQNLEANTMYYYTLQATCGSYTSDWLSISSFNTACLPSDLPYEETFEADETSSFDCWTITGSGSAVANTSYKHSGNSSMSFKSVMAVSPQLNIEEIANYQLSGYSYKTTSDNLSFTVGVMTDLADASTFEPIQTISLTQTSTWSEFIVYFTSVATDPDLVDFISAKYMVIYFPSDSDIYLDDIVIEEIPTCLKPLNLNIANVTAETATFSWTGHGQAQAQVKLFTEPMTATSVPVFETILSGTENYTFTDLIPATNYYAYVNAICNEGDTAWQTTPARFATPCVTLATPFIQNFENLTSGIPTCWDNSVGTTTNASYKWNYYSADDNVCLRFNSYNNGNGYTNLLQTPNLHLGTDDILTFSFQNPSGGNMYVGVSTNGGATIVNLDTLANYSNWTEFSYSLADYADQTINIVFTAISNFGSRSAYLDIDNISIAPPPTCLATATCSVDSIKTTAARITITDIVENNWQLAIAPRGIEPQQVTELINTTSTTVAVNNLQPATNYDVYIRVACSMDDYSTWRGPIRFTTPCVPFVITEDNPFFEGFEQNHTDAITISGCWEQYSESGNQSWVANSIATTQNRSPYAGNFNATLTYSNTDWLFYRVSLQANVNYCFRAYARQDGATGANASLTLAYGQEATAAGMSNTLVVKPLINGDYQMLMSSFEVEEDGNYVIGIRGYISSGPWYLSLDNISLAVENCTMPLNATITEVLQNSALLSWTGTNDSYNIKVFSRNVSSDELNTASDAVISVNVDSVDSYLLEQLASNTTYYYAIQGVCDGSTSVWTDVKSFTTACDVFVVTTENPFFEGFENGYTNTETIARCWEQASEVGIGKWVANTEIARNCAPRTGGFNATLVYANTDWLFYNVSLVEGVSYKFRAFARQDGATGANASLTLAYGQEASAEGMTTTLITAPLVNGDYQMVTESFTVSETNNYVIGIKGAINSTPWYISLDDISLSVENCPMPKNIAISELKDNKAKFTWDSNAESFNLRIYNSSIAYTEIDNTPGSVYDDNITGNSYDIEGLVANSTYYYTIQSVCSPYVGEWTALRSFTTPCSAFEVTEETSFFEDFSGITSGIPTCWDNSIGTTTNDSYKWTYYAEAGNTCLRFNSYSNPNGTTNSVQTAPLLLGINDMLTFSYKNPTGGAMRVGISTNYGASITTIATLENYTNWTDISYSLANYAGQTVTIVFTGVSNAGVNGDINTAHAYLDNVTVQLTPACITPFDLQVTNVSATSATLSWIAGTSSVSYEFIANTDTLTTNSNNYVIDDLLSNTNYSVRVRAICDTDTTDWSNAVTFRTSMVAATLPYNCTFEDDNENAAWGLANSNQVNYWIFGTHSTGVSTGNKGLYITNDGASNAYSETSTSVTWAYRTINFPIAGGYDISFDWKCNGENVSDYLRAFLVPSDVHPEGGSLLLNGLSVTGTSTHVNDIVGGKLNLVENWQTVNISEYLVSEPGNYNLVFLWRNDYSIGNNAPAAIDNIVIAATTCRRVTSLSATEITASSATANWINSGESSAFEVLCIPSTESLTAETIATAITTTDTTYTFIGLAANTSYKIYVRSVCEQNDKSAWSNMTIQTPCMVYTAPFIERFETLAAGIPACWDNSLGTTTTASYKWNYYTEGDNICLRFNSFNNNSGYTNMVQTPSILVNDEILSFSYKNPKGGNMRVGVSTDGGATITTLATLTNVTNWTDYSYSLTDYNGQTITIVFTGISNFGSGDAYIYLDNVSVNCLGGTRIINENICVGSPYNAHGFNYTAAELPAGLKTVTKVMHYDNFCDTLVTLNLTVIPTPTTVVYDTICVGQRYSGYGFVDLTNTRTYYNYLTSSLGCDSIIELHLQVNQIRGQIDTTICEGTAYYFGGELITQSGVYTHTTPNASGCDSITTLSINIVPQHYRINHSICEGSSYLFVDTTLTTSGVYTHTFQNHFGCDSIVSLHLSVLETTYTVSDRICAGSVYQFGTQALTESGVYTETFSSSLGCDSVVTLTLIVDEAIRRVVHASICNGRPYNGNGFSNITVEGIYYNTLIAANGCDSIVELHVSETSTVYNSIEAFICDGDAYNFGGNSYTTAGVYNETFVSAVGCDSVVTLTLNIIPIIETKDTITITLDELPFTYGNLVVPIGTEIGVGNYQVVFSSANSCDSIVNLTLNIIAPNGINTVNYEVFSVLPNPIDRGAAVTVQYEFTPAQRNGLTVSVVNMLGQVIEKYTPDTYPIQVKNFSVNGYYLIRITTGTNETIIGRVIVK